MCVCVGRERERGKDGRSWEVGVSNRRKSLQGGLFLSISDKLRGCDRYNLMKGMIQRTKIVRVVRVMNEGKKYKFWSVACFE